MEEGQRGGTDRRDGEMSRRKTDQSGESHRCLRLFPLCQWTKIHPLLIFPHTRSGDMWTCLMNMITISTDNYLAAMKRSVITVAITDHNLLKIDIADTSYSLGCFSDVNINHVQRWLEYFVPFPPCLLLHRWNPCVHV